MTITSLNIQDGTFKERRCHPRIKKRYVFILLTILVILIIFSIYMLTKSPKINPFVEVLNPPNPESPPEASESILYEFQKRAVSSDARVCSSIGDDILSKNGSAVDATIATMFCNGLVTMQSMGIGGGFFMTIYSKLNNTAYVINAREKAPLSSLEDMYHDDESRSRRGPLAVAVPGEIKGYLLAHKLFGKLDWKTLIEPTINLCHEGYNITKHQYNALKDKVDLIKKDSVLNDLFINPEGDLKSQGSKVIHKKLCETLQVISLNPHDFYNGTLRDVIVQDIQDMGGIITKKDFDTYEAKLEVPVSVKIKEDTLYTVGSPAGGDILSFILNLLQEYNFSEDSIKDVNNTILTYHRIIEGFKYAYAKRGQLGDPDFNNLKTLLSGLSEKDFIERILNQISDNSTSEDPKHYGAEVYPTDDHGTSHISVLSENGDAVSVTSTINLYFGAGITSKSTGIILNSGMDDFSSAGFKNYFGIPFSPANKIQPGKRPLSSMCPSIILDKNKNVKMVVGAAGGTKIPSSVALVIMKTLWFGETLKEAIDGPRLHNQVFPMRVDYEFGMTNSVVEGLGKIGHTMKRLKGFAAVVNGIFKQNGTIFGNADYRKDGDVAGA